MVILYNAITYTNSKNRQCVDECSMCKKKTPATKTYARMVVSVLCNIQTNIIFTTFSR